MDLFGTAAPFVWLAVVAFGIILAIAWIALPFALFGTKPLLRELIIEVRRTNALLERQRIP
ncbi:MAG TPA: hypothetical protein VGK44_18680 [Casimicrobiaceae bacterium]|jgi:heme exporter protein D